MKLLKELTEISGVSGNESNIRKLILKEIKKYVKNVKVDKYGNIIAHKKGKGAKVMLAAHMDEIGFMVKSISSNGNINISAVGGIEALAYIGQKVNISVKGGISGVITLAGINDDEETEEVPEVADLMLLTGLTKKELQKKGVEIGTFIEPIQETYVLGKKGIICGKALDDRIGCYILLELARKLEKSKAHIYFVFTVQEEIGLYGSKTSVSSIDPDWAVAIDVTNADDSDEHTHNITKKIGKGPCVVIKDAEMISNLCLDKEIKKIAKKKKIKIQLDVSDFGTTDALSISISKGGIPTAIVGVAVKNLHTSYGISSLEDINETVKILEVLMKNPPKTCID
ncbi:M20/M25/M40 family metallo-hydrolase [archaeon]|jgi:tetrahedral aminopeptidase|nr:M20/M25/M40 family metallo-hydrolase [archaeon]MBT3730556.1 M20/M25/M40 family metallo-hydrolase [archaeon]MBT4669458.1 M20/M25/M40 family metallo-hydrolase [archaeon]MBT5030215.1 M20/M25/M40 family metallo-hydrolase [archaeon]MBT5287686.1 M20/M25/M40 family metallo-hydrolase [archaeon]